MLEFLTILPWALLVAMLPLILWRKPKLVDRDPVDRADAPLVSIIVPARNEADNIGLCLATLLDTDYPSYEVVVVDDRSDDGTGEILAELERRTDGRLKVIHGAPLPEGWVGKPWACWQGYREAEGSVLLFTDADTRHDSELLPRAVAALRDEEAGLVSVLPRQLMVSLWERLIMPQVWITLALRFPSASWINRADSPRDALANGQFLLFDREAYDAVGGHEAVQDCVVEDLRLAQLVVAAKRTLHMSHAEELMETRMYRTLGDIVEGWSKNVAQGSALTVAGWLRPVVPWLIMASPLALWVTPLAVLALATVGLVGGWALSWGLWTTGLALAFWLAMYARLRLSPALAFLFPVGALAAAAIFGRSAVRGKRFSWKGRSYSGRGGETAVRT